MIEIRHHHPTEKARPFKKGIDSDGPAEIVPNRREAHGRAPHLSAGREHFRSQHPDGRVFRQMVDHGGDAIVQELHIRIHQANVVSGAFGDADVIGLGKAKIFRIANQLEFREHFRHQFRSSVGGSVVDHDHFRAGLGAVLP